MPADRHVGFHLILQLLLPGGAAEAAAAEAAAAEAARHVAGVVAVPVALHAPEPLALPAQLEQPQQPGRAPTGMLARPCISAQMSKRNNPHTKQ